MRKGLFHPNDIKTVGLGKIDPSPSTAPLPQDQSRGMRPSPVASSSHSRASSVSGSFGRSDAIHALSSSDFGRYTEGEDEDYEDVFAKPNGPGMFDHLWFFFFLIKECWQVTEPPGTLQLTTRLSNKSWVRPLTQLLGRSIHYLLIARG